jgi:hypothetical protein
MLRRDALEAAERRVADAASRSQTLLEDAKRQAAERLAEGRGQ